MVHHEPLLGPAIQIRWGDALTGPWSAATSVWEPQGVRGNKHVFAYAAKGHSESSAPGELLVSYVINSHHFREAAANAEIYRPRFIRLNWSRLPAP